MVFDKFFLIVVSGFLFWEVEVGVFLREVFSLRYILRIEIWRWIRVEY